MKSLNHTCQGASHIVAGKVCQDASWSSTDDGVTIAIVSDGHGGARYFRSDVGSQMAVDATRDCVADFVKNADGNLFAGKPFTQKQAISSEADTQNLTKDTETDKALRHLFASIIYTWHAKIEKHAQENPISDAERQAVDPSHVSAFEKGEGLEKTYGCTLMCCVVTPSYWFAFHVGDGKCIAFSEGGNWSEPIPWDERCFLNKTTSLCDSAALDEFRYCYEGDGQFPLAVILGSDGMDDSFGETENMVNFYVQVLKLIVRQGHDAALNEIKETLPELSKKGSQDDMSMAVVYNDETIVQNVPQLIAWQKSNIGQQIQQVDDRIGKLRDKLEALNSQLQSFQKVKIEHDYAQKDLDQANQTRRTLEDKLAKLDEEEKAPTTVTPQPDEVESDISPETQTPETDTTQPEIDNTPSTSDPENAEECAGEAPKPGEPAPAPTQNPDEESVDVTVPKEESNKGFLSRALDYIFFRW